MYIPFLVVAYIGSFLYAAYVLKKKRRAILWAAAMFLFLTIMLLMGLGLFTPRSWVEIISTFLALISSGMLACLAETKFPEQKRDDVQHDPNVVQEDSHDDNDADETHEGIKLSSKLDTQLARQVFANALKAGLMEDVDGHYKWKGTKVQLAYLCGRIYCEDRAQYDKIEGKSYWRFGFTEFFPDSELNELFQETDLGQSRQNRKDLPVPQGSNKIDDLFK